VLNACNLPLSGIPLRRVLAERLGRPVIVENDGNCAAVAEACTADSGTIRNVVALTLGTGVGGGVIAEGHLLRGSSGRGAELGHLVVDATGPRCFGSCPSRGCLEALCSGTALARDGKLIAMNAPRSRLARILRQTGRIRSEDVVESARAGDHRAAGIMDEFGRALGVGLASLINIFDPTELAIGGGLSEAGDLFLTTAVDEVAIRITPAQLDLVDIRLARSGRYASVTGAAFLALQAVGGGKRPTTALGIAPWR
jgi:glucokinase